MASFTLLQIFVITRTLCRWHNVFCCMLHGLNGVIRVHSPSTDTKNSHQEMTKKTQKDKESIKKELERELESSFQIGNSRLTKKILTHLCLLICLQSYQSTNNMTIGDHILVGMVECPSWSYAGLVFDLFPVNVVFIIYLVVTNSWCLFPVFNQYMFFLQFISLVHDIPDCFFTILQSTSSRPV